MRATEIVKQLGVTHQRVRQLVIKLHAQGYVTFGDAENPFWIIRRTDDRTPLLSRDKERVFQQSRKIIWRCCQDKANGAYAWERVGNKILSRLIANRFVEEFDGLQGNKVYPLSDTGCNHPQRDHSARRAAVPRLPVGSDRIREVLSTISDSGALRIRDVTEVLRISRKSMNALMQYLKRKFLVKKTRSEFEAPYSLTSEGRAPLAEWHGDLLHNIHRSVQEGRRLRLAEREHLTRTLRSR
jgi:Mn-dependent DtxR family transcriptional regulator